MDYKLVRSKRKTKAIYIVGGAVTVKAPKNEPTESIELFVAQKQGWIQKKLAEYRTKLGNLAPVMSYERAMLGGVAVPIAVTDGVKRVKYEDGAVKVPVKYDDVTAAVSAWYRRTAKAELQSALDGISSSTGLKYASFALTNARGKWGSCDGKCNIRLNWRLVMLEPELVRYVIVHELCHTLHHDHSAAFWQEVQKHCPDYKERRKRLKMFSVLTTIYR